MHEWVLRILLAVCPSLTYVRWFDWHKALDYTENENVGNEFENHRHVDVEHTTAENDPIQERRWQKWQK